MGAAQRGAHGEEVGRGGDVVEAEDVPPRVDSVGERGEGSGEALAGAPPGERADEVLPRDRDQERAGELVETVELAEQSDGLRGGLREVRPGVHEELLGADAPLEGDVDALAEEGEDLRGDVRVEVGVLEAVAGGRAVCITTSAAPVAAQMSARAGSRRPLTSLTMRAPASIAARATSGL